jgi:hypothetical protein
VQCEPVSTPISLISGKNTGKFARAGHLGTHISVDISIFWHFSAVSLGKETGNFPTGNRESNTGNREQL